METVYMSDRWAGKVALVTGASAGIGYATALRLAEAGMKVAVCARRMKRLEALAREAEPTPGEILPVQIDLKDEAQLRTLFDRVRKTWGGVDVLVNNAGLGHQAPLMSGDTEAWREMLELNVLSLCICTREAVQDMQRRGVAGHIIHISSMAGHRVPPGSGVYSATKYAVRALTEALRLELREAGSATRVTEISPGFVETEFAAHYHRSEDKARGIYSHIKVLESQDVAEAVYYVLNQPEHVQIHDVLMRPTHQRG